MHPTIGYSAKNHLVRDIKVHDQGQWYTMAPAERFRRDITNGAHTRTLNGYREVYLVLECEENHLRSSAMERVNDHYNDKHSVERTLL
jgi:hypothetical protein